MIPLPNVETIARTYTAYDVRRATAMDPEEDLDYLTSTDAGRRLVALADKHGLDLRGAMQRWPDLAAVYSQTRAVPLAKRIEGHRIERPSTAGDVGTRLDERVRQLRQQAPRLTYAEALRQILRTDAVLADEFLRS